MFERLVEQLPEDQRAVALQALIQTTGLEIVEADKDNEAS